MIKEVCREYDIVINPDPEGYEDARVRICTEFLDPKSKHFTHCSLEYHQGKYRSIDDHIKYYTKLIKGLKELKNKLEQGHEEH